MGTEAINQWESNPGLYTSIVANNGGRVPEWLAGPTLKAKVASDLTKLRTAPYALDLRTVGKTAPWLRHAGNTLGGISVFVEFSDGVAHRDGSEIGHSLVSGAIWGVGLALTPVGGFALGLAWTGADLLAQQYTYEGQNGWTAVLKSTRDKGANAWDALWRSQDAMQRQNPDAYHQLWSQPNL